MTREEAHTLLEVMAINLTGAIANSEDPVTEQTKLMAKQIEAIDMAVEALQTEAVPQRGTYQCFHCGSYSVVWGADFSFEDYGYEGEGIIHSCHCSNCGAEIEYWIPLDSEEDRQEQ